jgi:hypothetical protein
LTLTVQEVAACAHSYATSIGGHEIDIQNQSASWSASHVQAKPQSRFRVAIEMFSASVASVSLRPPKKTHFDYFGCPRVERLQAGQALVDRQQSFIEFPGSPVRFQEFEPDLASARAFRSGHDAHGPPARA